MEAFVGLMEDNSFEKITIHAIADRANVNRGTIYLHFADKYELLDQCIETYLQLLRESCMPGGDPNGVSAKVLLLRTFEFLEQHASIYSSLLASKGVPAFRKQMMVILEINIEEHIKNSGVSSVIKREILVQFLSIAVAGLIEWWIIKSMPFTPEEIVEQLLLILERNLILPERP